MIALPGDYDGALMFAVWRKSITHNHQSSELVALASNESQNAYSSLDASKGTKEKADVKLTNVCLTLISNRLLCKTFYNVNQNVLRVHSSTKYFSQIWRQTATVSTTYYWKRVGHYLIVTAQSFLVRTPYSNARGLQISQTTANPKVDNETKLSLNVNRAVSWHFTRYTFPFS